ALEAEGEFLVVEAQEMEDGRLEIVNVDSVLSREESELVAGADGGAGLNAAAGEPHGVGVDVMVAADGLADFTHRRAAELASPNDQCLVKQAALLEIANESGGGLVGFLADAVQPFIEV